MAAYVERGVTPGLVSLVSRGGEAHVEAMGVKALNGKSRVDRDTIFRISSMSKPITAVAALILVEECKLRLDDPIDFWLPELANPRVLKRIDGPVEDTEAAHRPISLRDLLTFRLGTGMLFGTNEQAPILRALADAGFAAGPPQPAKPPAPDAWLERFARIPLMYQPGERWLYNTGSELLGILIARASGTSFDVFLRERIFEPLGMKDTGFFVPANKLTRFTDAYLTQPGGVLQPFDAADGGQWSRPPAFPSGAGGLVSTIDDYHAFARMLLQGGKLGKERILARTSVELMTSDQLTQEQKDRSRLMPSDFQNYGFGFGVSVITRRDRTHENLGQYGWDGGLGTSWRNDPKADFITILLTQASWSSPTPPPISWDFWTAAYQALED